MPNGCRSFLSPADQELVALWRDQGVLQDDMTQAFLPGAGLILVSCADGDRFPDLLAHKLGTYKDKAGVPCVHTLSLNGGAPTIAPDGPFNKIPSAQADVLLQNIRDARAIKQLDTIALYGHAPCGVAGMHEVGLRELLDLLIRAKRRIKNDPQFSGAKVACFLHCDFSPERMRTYFVSAAAAKEWFEKNPAS